MQTFNCYMVMTWDDSEPGESKLHMVLSSLDADLFHRLVLYVRPSDCIKILGTAVVTLDTDAWPPMFKRICTFVDPTCFAGPGSEDKWCLIASDAEARALHAEWKADPRYGLGVAQSKEPTPKTPGPHKMPCEEYYRNQVDHFLHKLEARWNVSTPTRSKRKLGAKRRE